VQLGLRMKFLLTLVMKTPREAKQGGVWNPALFGGNPPLSGPQVWAPCSLLCVGGPHILEATRIMPTKCRTVRGGRCPTSLWGLVVTCAKAGNVCPGRTCNQRHLWENLTFREFKTQLLLNSCHHIFHWIPVCEPEAPAPLFWTHSVTLGKSLNLSGPPFLPPVPRVLD
jgi:hypothetical protein